MKPAHMIIAAAAMTVSAAQASHIQTQSIGTGRSTGIRVDAATPLERGRWSIGLNFEHADSDRLSDSELLALSEADEEADLHSLASIVTLGLDLGYGVTERLTLGLRVPYLVRSDIVAPEHHHEEEPSASSRARPLAVHADGIEVGGRSAGLGDVTAYAMWRVMGGEGTGFNLSLLGGLEMPTGSDTRRGRNGERFEAEFQPGSDSWDPFAGVAVRAAVGGVMLAASSSYQLVSEGGQDVDLGDQWTYGAAAGLPIGEVEGTSWTAVAELTGGWRDRLDEAGVAEANSGGSWLFFSPGITVNGKYWSAYASWSIPLDGELHGDQDDLGDRVLVGFQFQY
jgi:hypothetical protein